MNWRNLFIPLVLVSLSARAQVPGDEHWDVRFGSSGADNNVFTVTRHGSDVYIAGLFSMAGNANATNVARWDALNWHAVGDGLGNIPNTTYVYALAFGDGDTLYAGGYFTNSGDAVVRTVARWNGTQWQQLGDLRGIVTELVFLDGTLYAGGLLVVPGDTNNYAVARWTGSAWDTMGSTVSGCVGQFCFANVGRLLVQSPSEIYAVGQFTNFASLAANNIVKWDGTGWSALGTGLTGGTNIWVTGITMHSGQLYVGGSFWSAGGLSTTNVAIWDGANWQAFPGGGANRSVRTLVSDGFYLYAGGEFTVIGGVSALRIARWDGLGWSPMETGVADGPIYDAEVVLGELLVAGQFSAIGSAGAYGVARWDGSRWYGLNSGTQNGMNVPLGVVRAFDVFNDALYVGGDFRSAGSEVRSKIAQWNGGGWSSLGEGILGATSDRIRAITHTDSDLYVGGTFTNIGGIIASNFARWNGSNWEAAGGGVNSNVNALAAVGGVVWAGGSFTRAGTLSVNRIAGWNGFGWASFVGGANSNINAMIDWQDRLVIGGQFTTIAGVAANKLARNMGASGWQSIGGNVLPVGGSVNALAATETELYVGGVFVIPGINATNIARWDGVSWSALGGGVIGRGNAGVNAIALRGSDVYVAGAITNAGGLPVQAIARWDGANWQTLGSGFNMSPGNPTISALALYQDSIYAGGLFNRVGGRPSICIARWIPDINLQITDFTYTFLPEFSINQTSLVGRGTFGLKIRLDASSDLNTWTPLERQNGYYDLLQFTDPAPPRSGRIYRLLAEP